MGIQPQSSSSHQACRLDSWIKPASNITAHANLTGQPLSFGVEKPLLLLFQRTKMFASFQNEDSTGIARSKSTAGRLNGDASTFTGIQQALTELGLKRSESFDFDPVGGQLAASTSNESPHPHTRFAFGLSI